MGKKGNNKKKTSASKTPVRTSQPNLVSAIIQDEVKNEEIPDSHFTCTGALRRQSNWKDIIIDAFSLSFHGKELISDTTFQLASGRRYGLVGPNGSGKSTLLNCIASCEIALPDHIDVYHVSSEVAASEISAIDCVLQVESERVKLEEKAQNLSDLLSKFDGEEADAINSKLCEIYERLDAMDADTARTKASKILAGLGFTVQMQNKKTKDFSGGWRMRIALARALFISPTLLLLDEPTNHLDMEACVWLEEYLKKWNPKGILLLISHSQDFLNGVCTNIIHLYYKKLHYYSGNYDQYIQTRFEKEEHQMKNFKWEQDQIKHMKDYIARFGHGSAKLARQAKSKEKTLARMERGGLTSLVRREKAVSFAFPDPEDLPPPVLVFQGVSYGYPGCPPLYKHLEFGIDLDSRVALVGPNGVGKTTLLKLMLGELNPTEGQITPHNKLRLSRFNQHFVDQLDMSLTPLQFMRSEFPEVTEEDMRSWLGRFGVTGGPQTQKMETLSDGQKSRVIFSYMAHTNPHILLLDEPTNHLDIETIDALAAAINAFEGGVILVSHDMRLISVVAEELWLCENQGVTIYRGDILAYKKKLRDDIYASRLLDEDD